MPGGAVGLLVYTRSVEVLHDPEHAYTRRLLSDVPRLHEAAGPSAGTGQVDPGARRVPAAQGQPEQHRPA